MCNKKFQKEGNVWFTKAYSLKCQYFVARLVFDWMIGDLMPLSILLWYFVSVSSVLVVETGGAGKHHGPMVILHNF